MEKLTKDNICINSFDGQIRRVVFSKDVFATHKPKCFKPYDDATYFNEGKYESQNIYPGFKYRRICLGCGDSCLSNGLSHAFSN